MDNLDILLGEHGARLASIDFIRFNKEDFNH